MKKEKVTHLFLRIFPPFLVVLSLLIMIKSGFLLADKYAVTEENFFLRLGHMYGEYSFHFGFRNEEIIYAIWPFYCGLLIMCGIAGIWGAIGILKRQRLGLNIVRVVLMVYVLYELLTLFSFIMQIYVFSYENPSFSPSSLQRLPGPPDVFWPIIISVIIIGITLFLIYLLYTSIIKRQFEK